jgi:hypothetical protein
MLEVVGGHHVSRPRGVDALTAMQDQGKRERGTVAWRQESGAALDSTAAAAYALADSARTRPGAALHPARRARSSQTGIPGLGDFQSVLDILRNEEPL